MRRWVTGRPDQLRTCSAIQLSRQEWDGSAIGGWLREIDDRRCGGLFCGLREVDGRFDQSRLDRVYEVSRIGALHGLIDGIDLMKVADYYLGAEFLQSH